MPEHILLENATIVTMNSEREILTNTSLVISNEKIAAIGEPKTLREQHQSAESIDCRGKVILPGFINAHTHVALSLQKGVSMAVPDGLYRVMWPIERSLTPEDCYIGALAGGAEALKGGTTSVVDRYFFMEQTAQATTVLGLRGFLGHTIMSRLGPRTGEKELEEAIDFVQRWKDKNPLVTPNLAPHATDTVSKEWLIKLREIAHNERLILQLHVAQTPKEKEYIQEKFGLGCIEYLDDIGFLEKDVLAAHCNYIDEHEFDILAKRGAHPVYCPMLHALSGYPAQAWPMLNMGVQVLIGTDCVTKNNVMDIVGELRIAGASQKQLAKDPEAMPAMKLLEMVTVDAAEALGVGNKLGKLVPGYLADIIILNFDGLHAAPNYFTLDNIVYTCNGRDVNTVIVNGNIVIKDGKLLTFDESDLIKNVQERGELLIKKVVGEEKNILKNWQERHSLVIPNQG
jgi:5-methylthioadenosine/S-adenosylhomocysteine deaminase